MFYILYTVSVVWQGVVMENARPFFEFYNVQL